VSGLAPNARVSKQGTTERFRVISGPWADSGGSSFYLLERLAVPGVYTIGHGQYLKPFEPKKGDRGQFNTGTRTLVVHHVDDVCAVTTTSSGDLRVDYRDWFDENWAPE
jgi:hypothetical protein